MNKMIIRRNVWWASNGCDCCEPTEMEYFTIHTPGGYDVSTNGTPHTLEDALLELKEMGLDFLGYTYEDAQ